MAQTDDLLNSIKKECHKPISNDWFKRLTHVKDLVLQDSGSQSLLLNLINSRPVAHDSWFNFYFNNYTFEDLARINPHKGEYKQIIKVVNALVAKKSLPRLQEYWAWLEKSDKHHLALKHTYGYDKNILHICIDSGFEEGLAFFHPMLPQSLEWHAKTSNDSIPINSLDLALSRSGYSNGPIVSYILKNLDFDKEITTIQDYGSKSNRLDQIRLENAYSVSPITLIQKPHLIHAYISRLHSNINYFANPSIFVSFISNPTLSIEEKKYVVASYRTIIEEDLFSSKTSDKNNNFSPTTVWHAQIYLTMLAKIIELTDFSSVDINYTKKLMQKPNTAFSASKPEDKQEFLAFFERYCLDNELIYNSPPQISGLEKSKNKI